MTDTRRIEPARGPLRGAVRVPGDKSIAHRSLILGAIAEGEQRISGLPDSGDVSSTAACLQALGCEVVREEGGRARVRGGRWKKGQLLDAGNAGTTARLLAGVLAGLGLDATLDGDASLRKRPMKRVADPLRLMGASLETAPGERLPMRVGGGALRGITYHPPVASAQVKSCVLLAGLFAEGETTVVERAPTRDHTEVMLEGMGVAVRRDGPAVTVPGGARLRATEVQVPGDISSAAFFLAAASMVGGSELLLPDVGVNATRTGILDVLEAMGADVTRERERRVAGEDIADLRVRTAALRGVEIGGALVPRLIDELPILAVLATCAEGETVVRDAEELRHKESDRIAGVVTNLRALGADVSEARDGFVVRGPCALRGATVDAHGDHRLAMSAAVAGLVAEGSTVISGAASAAISYPGFFEDLRRAASAG